MASDDDQRQVERVTSRAAVEVVEDQRSDPQSAPQSVSQPVPTVRVGGSSGSGTRSGVGSRASETNTDDCETKRVRFTESQKRQGEDVEEMAAKAEDQHLDADVEVPAHKTWRVEDVVGDATDAAPEQMNILLDAREQPRTAWCRARRRCSRKLKSHSDHCVSSKISTMTRSWS